MGVRSMGVRAFVNNENYYYTVVLFHHEIYDEYWDVYVHCYSFWSTDLGFLEPGNYGFTIANPLGCFCAGTFF